MVTGNPDLDFFEQNPTLKYKGFFNEILSSEKEASKICWSLWYLEDPDSPLYNASPDIRLEELKKYYFKDLNWDLVEKYRRGYVDATMPKEKVLYKIAYDKLQDLTYNLASKDLENEAEWKQTVLLLDKLSKLWQSMEDLKVKYDEAKSKVSVKGGGVQSSRESRYG